VKSFIVILKAGFSPKDWLIKTPQASFKLAANIASEFGRGESALEIPQFFEGELADEVSFPGELSEDEFQRIKEILRWEEIKRAFDEKTIKNFAFFWFCLYFLESKGLLPATDEISLKLNEAMEQTLGKILGENKEKLTEAIEDKVETLVTKGIIWAADIFRLPEVL